MNDTFANNKVYEDDRWPWGDEMEKKQYTRQPQKTLVFPCFLATPSEFKKPWEYLVGEPLPETTDECEMRGYLKTPNSENAIFSQVFWLQNGLALICGPRGGVFFIDLVRRRRFSTLFFETHFRKRIFTETILHYKYSGFGTFHER